MKSVLAEYKGKKKDLSHKADYFYVHHSLWELTIKYAKFHY